MAQGTTLKEGRFNIRLTSAAKQRIERAASLEGKTASSFILSSALAHAELTIREHETRTRAGQDMRRRIASVFVCSAEGSDSILGFYTLSSLSIDASALPQRLARRLPRHPIPAALLGRLAVSAHAHGQGIGKLLLADAVKRCLAVGNQMAVYALVVDAKDEIAKRFYIRFGFIPFAGQSARLFLPLATVS